ncbi:unnamed protein product [Allacma fusca]|uniref:Uncharacterized protein n=1 Tax=Allacma fusca TaxID=39272 RepID=A0A8J2Q647_9HEXA|nr:unnamed protein product [Allacma fusca]
MLGFCDAEFYVPKPSSECKGGFLFGERLPKCVCLKGIYQTYMANCDKGVGFAEEVCTRTEDLATGVKVIGVRITEDPNWNEVGLVYYSSGGMTPDFTYMKEGKTGKLAGERFFTMNGIAKIQKTVTKGIRTHKICIEHKPGMKDNICMYRHTDNVDLWHLEKEYPYSVYVMVKKKCPTGGGEYAPMHIGKCFSPLTLLDSDCQVPCDKSNVLVETDTVSIAQGSADMDKNCTTDPQSFFRHENKFIDRQLLTFMVIDQIKNDTVNVTVPEVDIKKFPGVDRAYQMYDIIRDIANRSCAFPHLHLEIWGWASKLFMYLHKANKMQYDIPFDEADFNWIMDILSKCSVNVTALVLTARDKNPMCFTSKKALGYCDPRSPKGDCDFVPVKISPMYQDYTIKHYIPELVWLFLDIVHIQCFKAYADSYRMFHVMERVYEKLFTTPIKDYWHYPTWSTQVKNSLMTIEADNIMWNAEICAEAVYKRHHNKLYRLARPSKYSYSARKKRAAEMVTSSYDISCAATRSDLKIPDACKKRPVLTKAGLVEGGEVKGR